MEIEPVKVFFRVRPTQLWETTSSPGKFIDLNNCSEKMIVINDTPFAFDHIFYSSSTQKEIFKIMVEPSLEKFIEGFNCSLLAYGQSGAGKTFTMGLNGNLGMIFLSLSKIFEKLGERSETSEDEVSVSFIEIYNEKVFDLLSDKGQEPIYSKGATWRGGNKVAVQSLKEASDILNQGETNRHTRATTLNRASSRSHALFSVFLHTCSDTHETSSVMHFCDLAGSEGLRTTQHKGLAQQEGVNINQGLLSVGKVVQALSSGKKLIPYRDSVLTSVLQDSLNIKSYLNIVACISPLRKDKNETMSTIRFAQSVKTLDAKNVPEFNAYLKEKQRLNARTPLKPYMLPVTRNERAKTPGKTPGRLIVPSTVKRQPIGSSRFHQSYITPAKPSAKKHHLRQTEIPKAADMTFMHQTLETVNNNTFNILNLSTSTEVDEPASLPLPTPAPTSNPIMSFSPLMRRIEQAIDGRLASFMETLKNQTVVPDTTQLRNAVRKSVRASLYEFAPIADVSADTTFNISDGNPTTSTALRQTVPPTQFDGIASSTKPLRRALNLHTTAVETTCFEAIDNHDFTVPSMPKRRVNRRVTNFVQDETLQETLVNRPPPRRSTRISMFKETVMSKSGRVAKLADKTMKTPKSKNVVVNYFDKTVIESRHTSKAEHKKAILDLINKATIKELTLLPTIGIKTAYQIMTHRNINGSFKSIDDLKKLSALKGKFWDKFLEANLLK